MCSLSRQTLQTRNTLYKHPRQQLFLQARVFGDGVEALLAQIPRSTYVCVASVSAVPDSHAKSTNAATQDADVNEASFLSSLFKTGATHSLQRYIRRYVSNLILINQLHSINDVTGALHSDCALKISTSQN